VEKRKEVDLAKSKTKSRKPKKGQREPPKPARLDEDEIIRLAETRGDQPMLTAADLAFNWGVSVATIYKYTPRVVAYMTPWEKQEVLKAAEDCGVSPSMYLFLLHQEYSNLLKNKIKKGGLRAAS
jgi:hypothetical protein